jgi:hypothetical protein
MIPRLLLPIHSSPVIGFAFVLSLLGLYGVSFSRSLSTKTDSSHALLDSAVTRDSDGNGYLDGIELYFSAPVTLPQDSFFYHFVITYSGTIFNQPVTVSLYADTVYSMDSSGTKFHLHLLENWISLPGVPQTGWKPFVSISGTADSIPATQCNDGAGPVIWSVVKTIVDPADRKQDVVWVTFSEPIQGPNASNFSYTNEKPSEIFTDLRQNADSSWDTVDMFSPDGFAIDSFCRMVGDSVLEFKMSNGKDLTNADYLILNASANQIFDNRSRTGGGAGVPPQRDNRKAQVSVITTTFPDQMLIVPNPSWPTNMREKAGYFYLTNNPNALDWVRIDQSGIVIRFRVFVGADDSTTCGLKIFDSFGNEVASAEPFNGDYLRNVAAMSSADVPDAEVNVDIYWNGTTTKLPVEFVHEGIYLAEFTFRRKNDTRPTVLKQEFYMKKTDVGHSTCGGNVSIAFLPAVWLKTRRPLLRLVKNLLNKMKSPC